MSTRNGDTDTPLDPSESLAGIAGHFVNARRQGASLPDFPGDIPETLVSAYQVQDHAIGLWPDTVVGWKVGYIAAEKRDVSGDDRLLGPIFSAALHDGMAGSVEFPIYVGGFAAVEAEYVLKLQADAPEGKTDWTPEEAEALPATLHLGVEIASSPLATINILGPRVVVSDFGNNNGLILGGEIPDWRGIAETALTCQTFIDDQQVGNGGATTLPGGLRTAYAFALSRSAKRGRPLKAGDLIATGNATGIHDITAGQHARISFHGYGEISCVAKPAGTEAA